MKNKLSPADQDFTTFVKEIKSKIVSSQYEALKASKRVCWDERF